MPSRAMRRSRQALSKTACEAVLDRATSGVLSLLDEDGYPYAVPISFVRDGERLLFHSAREGHKIDAIRCCPRASFCVIDQDNVVPEEFTTYYRSVITCGTIRVLDDPSEVRRAIERLADRYAHEVGTSARDAEIARFDGRFCMLELTMESLTGKEAIELVRARRKAEHP